MKTLKIFCAALILIFSLIVGGCIGEDSSSLNKKSVAICFPNTSPSWERNGNALKKFLEEENFEVSLYYTKDADEQIQQFKKAVSKNVNCIVICTLGNDDMQAENLADAKEHNIPVIAVDGFIKNDNISYYTSFDNSSVGEFMGEYFESVLNLRNGGGPYNIEFFAGGGGGEIFLGGTMKILEPYLKSGQLICRSGQTAFDQVTVKDWNPANARTRIKELLSKYYTDAPLQVIVSPNDDTSGAIIEELEKAGKPYPLISGQDGDPAAFERIRKGTQTFTIAKDPDVLASKCVRMIKAVVEGIQPDINDMTNYNTGTKIIPAYLCTPQIIDKTNVK